MLSDGVYWQENPIYKEMQFSPFDMNDKTMGGYIRQMSEYRPAFLHGYPSALDVLAQYFIRNSLGHETLPGLEAVLLGSEGCDFTALKSDKINDGYA